MGTPDYVVEAMLNMANAGPGDYVIDLGSGDGRIVIEAAKRGAVGHGVELDSALVDLSYTLARENQVENRVSFIREDIFETDFSMASVITIYMSQRVNERLRPQFFEVLKPGTRIISHIFNMGDWEPDFFEQVDRHRIYGWIIPAQAKGRWRWNFDESDFEISIEQNYQNITVVQIIKPGRQVLLIESAELRGNRISLIMINEENHLRKVFNGVVDENTIEGTVTIDVDGKVYHQKWSAERVLSGGIHPR